MAARARAALHGRRYHPRRPLPVQRARSGRRFHAPVVPHAGEKAKTLLQLRAAGYFIRHTTNHSPAWRPFPPAGDSRDTTGKTPALALWILQDMGHCSSGTCWIHVLATSSDMPTGMSAWQA